MTRSAGKLISLALAAVLYLSALAFGAVHLWSGALLQIAVFTLAACWYFVRRVEGRDPSERTPRTFVLAAALLVAYLTFQLVPLPPAVLATLSPTTAELYENTHDVLAEIRVPDLAIRPVRSEADEIVPVEAREQIRTYARDTIESASGDARTIAVDSFQSRFELLRYLAYGLVLWLAATLPRPRLLLGAIGIGGAAMALLAIVELATWNGRILWFFVPYDHPGPLDGYRRMVGSFVNPDHFSAFVAFSFGPMLALLSAPAGEERRRRRRKGQGVVDPLRVAAVLLALAVMAAAILGSGSRGGIFGALLSAVVVTAGRSKVAAPVGGWRAVRGRQRKNRIARLRRTLDRALPVVLGLIVVVGGVSYVGTGGREMLDQRLAQTVYGSDLEVRQRFWSQTLPMIPDYALVGVGLGGWSEVIQRYQRYPNVWYRQNHSHNDYLEWMVEVGLVGVALTVVLGLAYVFWARANTAIPVLARAALVGSVVATAWHEFFDFVLRVPANAVLVAMILGLLCNRRWGAPTAPEPEPDDGSIVVDEKSGGAFGLARSVAFAVVAFVLTMQSVGDFREFLVWQSVREGNVSVARAPRSTETWAALGDLLARTGFRHHPPTIETYLAAARLSPTAEEAIHSLATTLPYTADRVTALEAAIHLDPTRSEWRLQYAASLEVLGRSDDALDQIERAVRLDPVLRRHGYATMPDETRPALVAAVEKGFLGAIADHGEVPAILSDFALFLRHHERFEEAAAMWTRAAEESREWTRFGYYAGDALARAGQLDEAEQTLRRVIRAAPDGHHAYRSLSLDVLKPQGKMDEAEEVLERGTRRAVRHRASLFLALSDLHRAQGEGKQALAALEKAANASRADASMQYRLGAAYVQAEDYHRGRAALSRAIRLAPEVASYHYLLGFAEERLYELGEARRAYARAVELDPEAARFRAGLERVEASFTGGSSPVNPAPDAEEAGRDLPTG